MKRLTHTLAASLMLTALAAVAQPSETGNTSGSGAKSPDTTRPDGAKGSGTAGAGDPAPSASAKSSKHGNNATRAKKGTQGNGPVNESPGKGSSDTPPQGGPSGGAKP